VKETRFVYSRKKAADTESADDSRAATNNITAGWKRDIDRCIRADRRLTSSEKIVAEAIVDFMNAKTGATFPSDQAIADRTGLSSQIVLRARANLKKTGWLDWDIIRGLVNHYRVLTGNLEAIEAEQAALDEARKQARKRPDNTSVTDDTPITNDRRPPSPVTDTPITNDRGPPSPVIGDPYHGRQSNPLKEPTERNPLKEPTKKTKEEEEPPGGGAPTGKVFRPDGDAPSPDSESSVEKAPTRPMPKTATPRPIPDDWPLTEARRKYAEYFGQNAERLHEKFVTHYRKTGRRIACWDIVFNEWVVNDFKKANGDQSGFAPQRIWIDDWGQRHNEKPTKEFAYWADGHNPGVKYGDDGLPRPRKEYWD
jgi:hypothetical protein